MTLTEEEIQEIQEIADLYKEIEETSEEEEDVIITQHKIASSKGKKGTSKKEVQFEDLPQGEKPRKRSIPDKGKGKEARKDQSTKGGDNPGDDYSSSSECSGGEENGSEDEFEDNTRKVRQLSPSQKEWDQVTGKKTLAKGMNKMNKNTGLVKLPTPEMFDGTNKTWRNSTTFD